MISLWLAVKKRSGRFARAKEEERLAGGSERGKQKF